MGSLSNYIEDEILDHFLLTGDYTPETNLYIGLSTADPTDDASGIAEPSGNGYARVNHDSWDAAASRATENTGTVTFPEATGTWGTITHFFICNHLTNATFGTNVELIAHGALSGSKTINSGDNASFADGAIDVSFNTGGLSTYLANALLDHIFKTTTYDTTASIYIALSTADPTDTGGSIAEPSGNNYARTEHAAYDVSASGASENTGSITFNQASGSWGTITYFAAFDALTDGNMLFYAALDASRNIGTNDTPLFQSGALDITLD